MSNMHKTHNNCFSLFPHVCPSADLIESFFLSLNSLSDCRITDEGFRSLAATLRSNPSSLRELWLHWNQPGPSALQLFSELQNDPNCKNIKIYGLSWIHSHFIPHLVFIYTVYKTNNYIWCKNDLVEWLVPCWSHCIYVYGQQFLSTVPIFV